MSEKIKTIVYVVTHGSYSDEIIDGIFTTKQLAESYMNSFPKGLCGYNEIEEFTLDPFIEEINSGYSIFEVVMDRNGNSEIQEFDKSFQITSKIGKYNFYAELNKGVFSVLAKDENHAIKIVNEKRLQLIAANKWGVND